MNKEKDVSNYQFSVCITKNCESLHEGYDWLPIDDQCTFSELSSQFGQGQDLNIRYDRYDPALGFLFTSNSGRVADRVETLATGKSPINPMTTGLELLMPGSALQPAGSSQEPPKAFHAQRKTFSKPPSALINSELAEVRADVPEPALHCTRR